LAALSLAAGLAAVSGWAVTPASAAPDKAKQAAPAGQDILIFLDGRIGTGKILAETPTTITFEGTVGDSKLSFKTEYNKADIAKITRGAAAASTTPGDSKPAPAPTLPSAPKADAPDVGDPAADGQKYYFVELKGNFGEDISQKPLWNCILDAKKRSADVLIFKLAADRYTDESKLAKLPDDRANLDEVFRAEDMCLLFVNQIPREWSNPPKVVMWVEQALAGAAFLPLCVPNIYMTPDARIGGFGNLQVILEGVGDSVVIQKQRSLRLGHCEGWAIAGGYDPRLVRAMASMDYVLSYRMDGDQPVFLERMPEGPNEYLLTDDGAGDSQPPRRDVLEDVVRGKGDDVLTLTPDVAKRLKVSKGTAETLDDLLFQLNLDRSGVRVDAGKGQKIMEDWSEGLANAKREIKRLMDEYGRVEVAPPAEYPQRTAARGTRTRIIDRILLLFKQYGEGMSARWLGQNGVPSEQDLIDLKETIRIEQMKDKPEKK
jgi:hypothetical protein